ncbi:hypothetical protein BDV95DRAFT_583111 [Massariosphaeria phaeospora]|uniref:Uncharacterized protein n=1 Tax=Massariosphaeria phaeospora TaxID=100035 RepID=A0A7C8I020_9PLEO|nr:hypothetical protein BDV95DRAFT_583111 [Massariosphaeria phaeospora]
MSVCRNLIAWYSRGTHCCCVDAWASRRHGSGRMRRVCELRSVGPWSMRKTCHQCRVW